MHTLVVFYSLEGNTRFIAEVIAKQLNADLLELKPVKAYQSTGFSRYFWGGKSVVLKEEPELVNAGIDLSKYDSIIIGTPVWANSFAPPLNTFVHRYQFSNKKVALFACHGGGGANKCFKNFHDALPGNQFIGEIDFVDPLKKSSEEKMQKAILWAESLVI